MRVFCSCVLVMVATAALAEPDGPALHTFGGAEQSAGSMVAHSMTSIVLASAETEWNTYVNERFGVAADYPAAFILHASGRLNALR